MPIQLNLTYADNSVVSALYRPVCDLLGCTWPVVLAGMGGVARADLVSAVTLAGGFGFLGMVREPTELLRDEVRRFTVAPCGKLRLRWMTRHKKTTLSFNHRPRCA